MFSLHETTQRRVCQVAFILCAVLPTLATLVIVAYSLRPWRESDWQQYLSRELRVKASIEHVSNPEPGVTRLLGVRFADLRSNQPLCQLDRMEVRQNKGRLAFSIDTLRMEVAQIGKLAATIETWLASDEKPPLEMHTNRLLLSRRGRQEMILNGARVQGGGEGQSKRMGIQCGTLRLLIERNDDISAVLETGTSSIPGWLLAEVLPSLDRCDRATFTGSLRLQSDAKGLAGALRGQFENVKLQQWVGHSSPHLLEGEANIYFDELCWHGGRVIAAAGRIIAENGVVGRSLLVALQERLYCAIDPAAKPAEVTQFDNFACAFQMYETGLSVQGECEGLTGCLITVGGSPLLLEPQYANLPVSQLVQILAHPAASWLPASVEAHEMAGRLPLPNGTKAR